MQGAPIAPTIDTPRLILRAQSMGDFRAHAAMLADPETTRFVGGEPVAPEDAWRKLIAAAGLWTLLGYGYWSVIRRSDDRYIGQVGFADFKREIEPPITGIPEMGWMFAPHAQGTGFASEAVAAALAWSERALPGQDVVAIIDAANAPSIRVAEKSGFMPDGIAAYHGAPITIYRRRALSGG